jgi:hypothetical protein
MQWGGGSYSAALLVLLNESLVIGAATPEALFLQKPIEKKECMHDVLKTS